MCEYAYITGYSSAPIPPRYVKARPVMAGFLRLNQDMARVPLSLRILRCPGLFCHMLVSVCGLSKIQALYDYH